MQISLCNQDFWLSSSNLILDPVWLFFGVTTQNWSKFKSSWYWQDDLRPRVSLGRKRRAETDQNITEQIRKTWKCHSLYRTNYRWHLSEPSPPCKSLLCRGIWQKKMFRIWRGQEKETTLRRVLGKWFCVDKLDRSEVGQDWHCGENKSMIIGKDFFLFNHNFTNHGNTNL